MKQMSLTGETSNGDKLKAEMQDLKTDNAILNALKPISEDITSIKTNMQMVLNSNKNHEERISKLEESKYKIAGISFIAGIIFSVGAFIIEKLYNKL